MDIYTVHKENHSNKILGSFNGTIKGDSFHGTWIGTPLSKRDYGPWVIKRKGDVVMENCYLVYVDSFDVEGQTIYVKGVPPLKTTCNLGDTPSNILMQSAFCTGDMLIFNR